MDGVAEVWTTPFPGAPVDAVVTLPGSKSVTARALVLAALADGPSRLLRPLRARDTDLMAAGLRALGVRVDDDGADWLVTPGALSGPARVDAGLAGTILRFLPPVAALANDSDFGLSAAVYAGDTERARSVADRLESGMVWINQPSGSSPELPFGGVKRSGYGRELSELGMFEFANRRLTRVVPAKKADKPQAG